MSEQKVVSVRMSAELHAELSEAAKEAGHTLAKEIKARLAGEYRPGQAAEIRRELGNAVIETVVAEVFGGLRGYNMAKDITAMLARLEAAMGTRVNESADTLEFFVDALREYVARNGSYDVKSYVWFGDHTRKWPSEAFNLPPRVQETSDAVSKMLTLPPIDVMEDFIETQIAETAREKGVSVEQAREEHEARSEALGQEIESIIAEAAEGRPREEIVVDLREAMRKRGMGGTDNAA